MGSPWFCCSHGCWMAFWEGITGSLFIFHVIFRSPHLSPFSLLLSRANSLTDTLQATLLLLSKTLGSNLVQKGSLLAPPRRPLSCVASHHPVHSYLSAPSPRLFPSRLNDPISKHQSTPSTHKITRPKLLDDLGLARGALGTLESDRQVGTDDLAIFKIRKKNNFSKGKEVERCRDGGRN